MSWRRFELEQRLFWGQVDSGDSGWLIALWDWAERLRLWKRS